MSLPAHTLVQPPADARRALLAQMLLAEAARPDTAPMSFAQQRLWFLDQLEPESCLYNLPLALRLSGPLNVPALRRTLQAIVHRHEILRTTFGAENDNPILIIADHVSLEMPLLDVHEAEVDPLIQQCIREPFDLGRGPLVRVLLLRRRSDEHILVLTLHHVVCDSWSVVVLLRELAGLYDAFAKGKASPLPDLPIQYADFAEWQRRHLRGAVLEKQLAYWMRELEGIPNLLELPTDRPRPSIQTYQGGHQSAVLPRELKEALKTLSQREGVTMFMTVLAIVKALLHRYTGQDDLVVGTPIANRTRREIEPLIGFFANTLVLRTQVRSDLTFRQLLGRVRRVALDAYDHQELPFEKLVETIQPERTLSHNPLFQVLVTFQNGLPDQLETCGLTLAPFEVHTGTAKFDLTFSLRETGPGLVADAEYNTDIFEAQTIRRLLGHFRTLTEGIVSNPAARLADLPLLSRAEQRQVLVEWNRTDRDFPRDRCLHEFFEEQAQKTPDAVAVVSADQRLSYGELDQRADGLARRLQALGIGPDRLVGLCVAPSPKMVVGMLGILKAGGAYVPLDPAYPPARLAFALADSGAQVIVTERKLVDRFAAHPARVLCLDEAADEQARPSAPLAPGHAVGPWPESTAYVIYTSGSTGQPKGVCVEHRNAATLIAWAQSTYTPEDLAGVLASTSLCFDLSVFEVFAPLSCGGKVILAENLLQLPALPARDEVTLINTVPSAMTELLRLGGVPASVRVVNLAGEPLPAKLVKDVCADTPVNRVFDLYGPTEDTVYSTAIQRRPDGPVTIGRPLHNKQIYILDPGLKPVPVGVPGELCISGAGLSRGYLNRADLTAEKLLPNPYSQVSGDRLYRTGDRARFLPDGTIEFLGRKDHLIKLRGYRIELGEIEATLRRLPAIRECLVMVREMESGDRTLVGYLVPEHGERLEVEKLRSFVAERLPGYMVPSAFVFLEALPRTPNGKVDRRALPAPATAGQKCAANYAAPRTATEQILTDIWRAVLGVEKLGIHEDFFDLGGHSLLVTRIIARVRSAFEIDLPIRAIFEAPTIAQLAGLIEKLLLQEIGNLPPDEPQPKSLQS